MSCDCKMNSKKISKCFKESVLNREDFSTKGFVLLCKRLTCRAEGIPTVLTPKFCRKACCDCSSPLIEFNIPNITGFYFRIFNLNIKESIRNPKFSIYCVYFRRSQLRSNTDVIISFSNSVNRSKLTTFISFLTCLNLIKSYWKAHYSC